MYLDAGCKKKLKNYDYGRIGEDASLTMEKLVEAFENQFGE